MRKLTAAGQTVQITHRGKPLWLVRAARANAGGEAERLRLMDEDLEALSRERRSNVSAARLIVDSREVPYPDRS